MISQIMPNTKLLQEMKSRMPIGLYVNSDEVSEFLIANPFGFQTPFFILNDAYQDNEIVITGNAEFSHNLADWSPIVGGRLTMAGRSKAYIRYKGDGEKVEIVESQYHYSIGGNLFSLTRKEWGVETSTTATDNGTLRGEFEQYFMNQTNLIHARLLMLAFKTDARAYNQLFKGCVNLEDIPVIVAEECQSATYSSFLSGCAKVSEIRCNITTWQQYTDFSLGLPAIGTFYKRESAVIPQGKDGIPEGWDIVDIDVNHLDNATPFWIKNLSKEETNAFTFEGTLQYSWDAVKWDDLVGQNGTLFPQQKVFLRTKPTSGSKVKITASTQAFEVGGNLFSLTRDEWTEETKCRSNEFRNWFLTNTQVSFADKLILPTNGDIAALQNLFINCINLKKIPTLTPKNVNLSFYSYTFSNTAIKEVKIIVEKFTDNLFQGIFSRCGSLQKIELYSKDNTQGVFVDWVKGVAEKGTFYKYEDVEIPIGTSGIPRGWKVVNVKREDEKPFNPNPYGNATPFWVKNVGLGENEIVLSGEYQYSINGKGWSDGKTPILKLAEGERMFIRTMPNGFSKVKIVSALRGYEIGGNFISLVADDMTKYPIGNFVDMFANTKKLMIADNLIFLDNPPLSASYFNGFFKSCADLQSATIKCNYNKLGSYCFNNFFKLCKKLNTIKLIVPKYIENAFDGITTDVAISGTFTKYRGVDIPTGTNGIPTGWDVVEVDPPTPTADTQPQPITNA